MQGCKSDPNHPYVYHAWARMEDRQGNHEVARSLFAVGFNAAPGSAAMLRAWSEMVNDLPKAPFTVRFHLSSGASETNVEMFHH